MSLLEKKDVDLLLRAGFEESDLGLVPGGKLGITLFESPDDYFAHELIENACEMGECSLYDEILPPSGKREPYDHSHPWLWEDQEYAGNEDIMEGVDPSLRPQIKFLLGIKVGKMSIWQKRNEDGSFEYPVKRINIKVPKEEQIRMATMSQADSKELWIKCAKEEWKKCWVACIDSIWSFPIEDTLKFITKKKTELSMLVIDADNIRKAGYDNLPMEARWVTMIYWEKDKK